MTTLALRILEVIAETYPASAHYRGGRKLRKAGWEKVFPEITRDVAAKNDFLDAVEELEGAGIVSAKWKRFRERDDLEALYLEEPEMMFELLGRPSPEGIAREMIDLLDRPEWSGAAAHPRLAEVAGCLLPRLEAGHPVPVSSAGELADLARLFSLSPQEATSAPTRALSIRLFGESKRLEALLPTADRLSRSVFGIALSEELGIGRSYPEVSFCLFGTITFADGSLWRCGGRVVTLPLGTVELIREVASCANAAEPAVLSIENKETFYLMAESRAPGHSALVYTAGHPNPAVVSLLRLLVRAGAAFSHYGDLDPDGILILQEIAASIGRPVAPHLMTAAIHRKYARFGYTLDDAQMARLSGVADDTHPQLLELAHEIRATGVGVEQEIIDTNVE